MNRFIFALVLCFGILRAQPPAPPLLDCGQHGTSEIICGTRSPEDLELAPDGKHLIVSQFVKGGGLYLFDLQSKTFRKMEIRAELKAGWGDAACTGPVGDALATHGISLRKRTGGAMELFVVNHGARESIEMFELAKEQLIWRGCVISAQAYNDVAALPDGGFFATHPTALRTPDMDPFTGAASGYVSRWEPGTGETELAGTRFGYPNGVVASSDARFIYYNAWTAREVHKYDVAAGKDAMAIKLDFMPDNLTWMKNGHMLSAGVKGARGDCPVGSGSPCRQGFGVAEIDPATMIAKTLDTPAKTISGVSVALEVGKFIYVGAFEGERIARIPKLK